MKKLVYIIFLIVPAMLFAQPGFIVETSSGYTDNAFNNYHQNSDYYNWINAYANIDWIQSNNGIRLYYDGSVALYNQYTDKNYMLHDLGLSYYHYLGENGNRINVGIKTGKRQHSEAYSWYELTSANIYANIKWVLDSQWFGYAGLELDMQNYEILDPFSNTQNRFYLRISRFFNSGTTFIAETDLLSKYYKSQGKTTPVENFPDIVTIGDDNSQQLQALIRLAQGITPKTGLSGQVLVRRNLSNSTRYLGTETGFYYSDEEIFDDKFGYNALELDLKLKQHLPWKSVLSIGSTLKDKDYLDRLAMDLDGNIFADYRTRKDSRTTIWLNLQKSISLFSKTSPLTLSLTLTRIHNKSNDLYYNYNTQHLNFTLKQSLK